MKSSIAGAFALVLLAGGCAETGTSGGGDFGTVLGGVLGQIGQEQGSGALTSFEINAGLKQALEIGANNVAGRIGVTDGYFGDAQIRIPLPGRLGELQSQLSQIGLSGPLDDLQLRMNRAAEASVPQAKKLIVSAVTSMTIDDALGILRGGDTAATDFLRARTETGLRETFTPYVESALQGSGAYQAFDGLTAQYGLGGIAGNLKNDLTVYAVNLGLDGMFFYIAAEEKKIRENPVARTTDLLRKVFGAVT